MDEILKTNSENMSEVKIKHEQDSITEEQTKNVAVDSPKPQKKLSPAIIAVICCSIVCIASLLTVVYITNQNNKRIAAENATQRVNTLIDEIYKVENCNGNDYLQAKDKLTEIKTLINENKLEGLPTEKYIDAAAYINDLQIVDDIYNLQINSDYENYAYKLYSLISKIKTEKIQNKVTLHSEIPAMCADAIKNVILTKAFNAAKKHFEKNYAGHTIRDIGEFTPYSNIDDNYTFIRANYAAVVSMNGVNGASVNSSQELTDYGYITSEFLASTVDKINANGGYAILINYIKDEDLGSSDPAVYSLFWYVGADVSAEITAGDISYNITRYVSGEPELHQGLSTSEALDFIMLNPA